MNPLAQRKGEHLDLCVGADVESRRSTLLDDVHLLHEAIPELSLEAIDSSVTLLGRRLEAPILITGMTGGTERAAEINRALARAAEALGLGMGLGSQRPMLERPDLAWTYRVRDVAPSVPILGNIGCVQARAAGVSRVADLVEAVEADALCVHLNPAQELVQDDGDRDFGRCLDTIDALREALFVPVIVKETGCGLSPSTLRRLRAAGIELVDVSGVGGTSWPGVESLRGSERQRALGGALREWGIPTAASLVYARRARLPAIASGGLRDAHDLVRALALGATAAGLALPFLRAFAKGGEDGVISFGRSLVETLRALMLLVGARTIAELPRLPIVLGPELRSWTDHDPAPRAGGPQAQPLIDWIHAQAQAVRP